jgi:hypothetical protein
MVSQKQQTSVNPFGRLPRSNLTMDITSHTQQNSTNPWMSWVFVLTLRNLDITSHTQQNSTNPWMSWVFVLVPYHDGGRIK